MKFHLKDLSLHYRVEGEGVPILLLHGRPTDHEAMVGAFEPIFSERTGYRRIYVDLPGMGRTSGGSWLMGNDDVVDVLLQFMDSLVGERPFLIAGFSYGGYIARGILYKRMAQVAGLMLLVPAVTPGEDIQLPEPRIFGHDTARFNQYPQPLVDRFAPLVVAHDTAVIDRLGEILGGLQRADQVTLARIGENYKFPFAVDDLPEPFEKPVLIFTGRHDAVIGYEEAGDLAKTYPRATYITLDRAGHAAHLEQAAVFNLLVHEWLDRVEESLRS
ncbi:alpha/beta fold hydrolase [Candidatus Leptofilum sp.]|uniref:alpha/beta fold hydrolase n=1 Tax=Candidatus Leptofilum sp. TaxID=3241576 RepID=UPI003B59FD8B